MDQSQTLSPSSKNVQLRFMLIYCPNKGATRWMDTYRLRCVCAVVDCLVCFDGPCLSDRFKQPCIHAVSNTRALQSQTRSPEKSNKINWQYSSVKSLGEEPLVVFFVLRGYYFETELKSIAITELTCPTLARFAVDGHHVFTVRPEVLVHILAERRYQLDVRWVVILERIHGIVLEVE